MTIRACYNCGSTEHTFYAEENGYSLVKCSECGLLFVVNAPDPQQIATATREGRHQGERELHVSGRFNGAAVPRYVALLRTLFGSDLLTITSWLDVGCGHGEFVLAVQDVSGGSISVRGNEPNVHKVQSAQSRGLDVSAFDIASHETRYDVVSLLDVYSHLPDPPAFIAQLRRLLHPGGELLLQTGDAADFAADDQFRPLDLPDHLSFASEGIVRDILERLGFEIVSVRKDSYFHRDAMSIMKEVVKLFLPGYRSRLRYYLRWSKYSGMNMHIRARLKNPE